MTSPFFQLGQAVAILESCNCRVVRAAQYGGTTMEFEVVWADCPPADINHITVVLKHYYPETGSQLIAAFASDPSEYNEGVYLAEVLGYICRIWCTG